jgi:hypothetical protein
MREKRGRAAWRAGGGLQRVLLILEAASRRWPAAALRRTRSCFQLEEEDVRFAQNPLNFEDLTGTLKTGRFCKLR